MNDWGFFGGLIDYLAGEIMKLVMLAIVAGIFIGGLISFVIWFFLLK